MYRGTPPGAATNRVGLLRRALSALWKLITQIFGALSTAIILAVVVTIPVLQFFALGYLLNAAGRLAKTGRFRDGFVGVEQAARIGQVLLGVWLVSLPNRLFSSLHADAMLIDPGSSPTRWMGRLSTISAIVAFYVVVAALSQGGHLVHFLRPLRAFRRSLAAIRSGGYFGQAQANAKRFVTGFAVPQIFWLGLRGYIGAGLWIVVPTSLIALGRKGPVALLGGAMLVGVLMYLPFLQIHFAVHGELRRMFQVQSVRYLFARAPIAFLFAFIATLLLALPLYLLKIELIPRDALWLPAAVFVFTIFPTKMITAWAYHRGAKREDPRHGVFRWLCRFLMLPVGAVYALVVFLTQYTGWHGLLGLYEHHAFLLPVPF
jgi:hypothetical protein